MAYQKQIYQFLNAEMVKIRCKIDVPVVTRWKDQKNRSIHFRHVQPEVKSITLTN